MIYMDMARLFEFKKTGFSKLDDEAATNGVYGLTVHINNVFFIVFLLYFFLLRQNF